jgi:hypothetical protein
MEKKKLERECEKGKLCPPTFALTRLTQSLTNSVFLNVIEHYNNLSNKGESLLSPVRACDYNRFSIEAKTSIIF